MGRPTKVGTSWVAVEEVPLPDGRTAKCYVAKKVEGISGGYVQVRTRTVSDPSQLRSFLGESADRLLADKKPLSGTEVSGDASLLIDPVTLDTKESKSIRRMELVIKGGGRSLSITATEVKETKEVRSK